VLGDEEYLAAAEKNLEFLRGKLWDPETKTLYHRWRDGERDSVQLLDAYANLLAGVIDLYEATLETKHIEFALELTESMMSRFYDDEHGGFWQSAGSSADLILRIKEDYDGAEPSGNSVAVIALIKMAEITGREEYKRAAERTLALFADRMRKLPQAVPLLLSGLDLWLREPRRVVIAGEPADPGARKLLRAAHSVYQPGKILMAAAGPVEEFARTLPASNGRPVAYVCTGAACQPPTSNDEALRTLLRNRQSSPAAPSASPPHANQLET
jgi:uncharacterized protein